MGAELKTSRVTKVLNKLANTQAADLEDFKNDRWFDRACFRRSLGKKPSWVNLPYRLFFNRALKEARRLGTRQNSRDVLVVPVWHCQAYEEAETKHSLRLLLYNGPSESFDLEEFKKPALIHAHVTKYYAPYVAPSRAYASSIRLPRFGPYAVVDSCCGLEVDELFRAVEPTTIPAPVAEVPPFNTRLTLAIAKGDMPAAFREPLSALLDDYNKPTVVD